jgi:hypothetical protein
MYLFLPVTGWPEVVDQTPTDPVISDKLGGALLCRGALPNGQMVILMRSDAAELPINPSASVLASFATGKTLPIRGPVAVADMEGVPVLREGVLGLDSHIKDMATAKAYDLLALAEDVSYAMLGQHDQISRVDDGKASVWAEQIRHLVANAEAEPLLDGYPDAYEVSKRLAAKQRAAAGDEVAVLFARLGLNVAPLAAGELP